LERDQSALEWQRVMKGYGKAACKTDKKVQNFDSKSEILSLDEKKNNKQINTFHPAFAFSLVICKNAQ